MTEAYPLQWPAGRPRTDVREYSRLDMTPGKAQQELLRECERMGGRSIVLSTNVELRRDGLPYAHLRAPDDPGVAVYFERKGEMVCFSCDRYHLVWENMRAIGKTIEAMRGIERWGANKVLDQMFQGFTALPSPDAGQVHWWYVLGCPQNASRGEIQDAWKSRVRDAPEGDWLAFNIARDTGLAALAA